MTSIYEQNIDRIRELVPEKQWAGEMWVSDCWRLNRRFTITEAFRTQARQQQLYNQGRKTPGPIVTHTLKSKHTEGLACDVYPINCTYRELEEVASKFGITHPFTTGAFIDMPHFEFTNAVPRPTPNIPRTTKAAERKAKRLPSPEKERLLARLKTPSR